MQKSIILSMVNFYKPLFIIYPIIVIVTMIVSDITFGQIMGYTFDLISIPIMTLYVPFIIGILDLTMYIEGVSMFIQAPITIVTVGIIAFTTVYIIILLVALPIWVLLEPGMEDALDSMDYSEDFIKPFINEAGIMVQMKQNDDINRIRGENADLANRIRSKY